MQPGKESNAPKNQKQTLATKIYAAQKELNLESRVVMKKKSKMQKEIKKMEGKNENPNNPTVEAARQLRGEQWSSWVGTVRGLGNQRVVDVLSHLVW